MALTFEGGSAARLENGRSLRNFEEGNQGGGWADAAACNSGYQLYKSLINNMLYHLKSSLGQN